MRQIICITVAALIGIIANIAQPGRPSFEEAFEEIYGMPRGEAVVHDRTTSKALFNGLNRMYRNGYDTLIVRCSNQAGLDWKLVTSLICQETDFMTNDTDSSIHRGLMQLSAVTAEMYGVTDLSDPKQNIEAGTRYLRHLMDIFQEEGIDSANSVKYALAAYNCGIGNVRKLRSQSDSSDSFNALFRNPDGPTRRYVNSIIYRYKRYNKLLY